MEGERDGRVVVTLHENFVREHIRYTDRRTGEEREFNQARVPSGTVVGGTDYGGWEFTPLSVGPSPPRGPRGRAPPPPADPQGLLRRAGPDAEGNPVLGEDGRRVRESARVDPAELRDAIVEGRRRWAREHSQGRALGARASEAREGSRGIAGDARQAREQGGRGQWDE